jgi:diacylglycerol kinase family enzyme
MVNDPLQAVKQLAAGIAANDIGPIGLGQVNGRYFCFHTGVGYDAAVVDEVEQRAQLKRWLGHPLFIYASLKTWSVGYERRRPHFAVHGADFDVADGYFTIVLNTNPYTYLGNLPLDLSPAATLDRGLVAVTFRTMRATAILGSLAGALRGGGVTPSDHLDVRTDLSEFTIRSCAPSGDDPHGTHAGEGSAEGAPFPYQVDGDFLGDTRELRFHHRPDAVRLVRPAPAP